MGGIEVTIHEPVNVLSTMLLALSGGPKDTKLPPIAADALEHVTPFADHPSIAWLREFYKPNGLLFLYGHVAQLSGPLSFATRSAIVPAYLADYEPQRMKDLPTRMAAFYEDAKLGTFRRTHVAAYTLAAAEVKDAIDGAHIEEFLARLYGPIAYELLVVPVPTNPIYGGGTGAMSGWEDFAFLHPPRLPPDSPDPVSWSLDPERTQVLVQHELSHALLYVATRERADLVPRLRPVLSRISRDAPFARSYPSPDLQFTELFIRGSSVSYLRRTRGDEAAQRWMDDQIRRRGIPAVRNFFLAIEEFLAGRWSDVHAFLDALPAVLSV